MNSYTTKDALGLLQPVTLAVSTQWRVFPEKFDWLVQEGFSLEYAPDVSKLENSSKHLTPYLRKGVQVRHHGYFPGFEIGDKRPDKAKQATHLHFQALDAIKGLGEQHITVHVGLTTEVELNHNTVIENLHSIVAYGKMLGITVSLENLRFGPTSNPETVLEWTRQTGAKITMDIGHALSSERVAKKELTVPRIIDMFSHDLVEVHFYESETDRHHAPQDMTVLGPIVDKLLTTQCTWWTIELDTYEEILRTRHLIFDHLVSTSPKLVNLPKSMFFNTSIPIACTPSV